MKWRGRGGGGRIEDRRGAGGGGFPIPMGKAGGGGLGLIILVVVYLLTGGVPGGGEAVSGSTPAPVSFSAPGASSTDLDKAPADDPGKFVDFVAGDVDATWQKLFADSGKIYEPPTVVLYDDAVTTACGDAPSTVGPFYCPLDRKVYLDLPFLEQLQQRLDARGDFAQAYVVAHEIGHHVQNLLGVMEDVDLSGQENPETGTSSRFGSSSRLTASPGSGRTRPTPEATCSRAATSRKGSTRRRPSGTTGSSSSRARRSTLTRLRTARPSSV